MSKVIVRFERDGQPLKITGFSMKDGIELGGERLARARQFALTYNLDHLNEIEKVAVRKHQQENEVGWNQLALKLTRTTDGNLEVTAQKGTLPAVSYRLTVKIEDMKITAPTRRFKLSETDPQVLDFTVQEDVGSIALTRTPSAFAPLIRDLVQSPSSGADGRALPVWVQNDAVRANRRACLLNILAKLRNIADGDGGSLIKHVKGIFLVDSDRVYAEVARGFLTSLRAIATEEHQLFYAETDTHSDTHDQLIRHMILSGGNFPADTYTERKRWYALRDFRQVARPSMQAVVAVPLKEQMTGGSKHDPGDENPNARHFVDLDIDLGVVKMDLVGAVTHFAEVLFPPRTDHLNVGKDLANQDGIKDFLYYEVT